MIVAFSTSSPVTSVALMDASGVVLWEMEEDAPGRASETSIRLLDEGLRETGLNLNQCSLFVSDQGPGSFTGVRVGVVIAKTLAWNYGVLCAGLDAFDLIDLERPVFVPSRKGEFFMRRPGHDPFKVTDLDAESVGYGVGPADVYPRASRAALSLDRLEGVAPEVFLPQYRMEPSISTPKRPLSRVQT